MWTRLNVKLQSFACDEHVAIYVKEKEKEGEEGEVFNFLLQTAKTWPTNYQGAGAELRDRAVILLVMDYI